MNGGDKGWELAGMEETRGWREWRSSLLEQEQQILPVLHAEIA